MFNYLDFLLPLGGLCFLKMFLLFGRFRDVGLLERDWLGLSFHFFVCFEILDCSQLIHYLYLVVLDLSLHRVSIQCAIVDFPQITDDRDEVQVFFLHLLVVTAALFSLARSYENLHSFEDFVSSPHMSVHKMLVVDFQKPMIFFVLLDRPMSPIDIFELLTSSFPLFTTLCTHLFFDKLILFTLDSLQRLVGPYQGSVCRKYITEGPEFQGYLFLFFAEQGRRL